MPCKRFIAFCSLFTALLFSSCTSQTPSITQTSLLVYRFEPPAFIEYSADLQPVNEIPFHLPPNCGLYNTFPAPIGKILAIELSCPGGQTLLFLDSASASVTQPVTDTDAHFLAWTSDGQAVYLKVDSLTSPRVVRVRVDGELDSLSINEFTYDLAAQPDSNDFTFTFSRGLGFGSEIHLARKNGRDTQLLYSDQFHYISFARFSPDGEQIAFIKIPDTQTPFTVGELWVMNADGSNPRKLADADAGHGYAANWSPDGKRIAWVVRENPEDVNADQLGEALISNIYVVDVASGQLTQITQYETGRVETPFWSPDGNTLTFNTVINGRMNVSIVEGLSGAIKSFEIDIVPVAGSACCPIWMRK